MTSYAEQASNRFQRLPKWAQDEIRHLARDRDHWQAQATAGPEGSDTFLSNGLENATPLGSGPTIRYALRPAPSGDVRGWGRHVDVRYDARRDLLDIRGGDTLLLTPEASNHITLRLSRD